jgi:hypothetical protein
MELPRFLEHLFQRYFQNADDPSVAKKPSKKI